MKLKQQIAAIAIASALGLVIVGEANAGAAKALSFIMVDNVAFFPDGGNDSNGDGTADCDIFDDNCFLPTQEIPVTASSASKIGVPGAGSSVINGAGRGPLNVDQACVARPPDPPAAQVPPFIAPCPDNDTYSQVPGFPANNFARADALIDAVAGFVFPGATCPADGTGACGNPANLDGADVMSIAEVQLNEDLESGVSQADSTDNFGALFGPLANAGETALTFTFELDWCREARLLTAVTPSIANPQTNANVVITIAATGEVVFDALASVPADSPIALLNGSTPLIPVAGDPPLTTTVREDRNGSVVDGGGCFDVARDKEMVAFNTNPNSLSKAACDGARPACFISDPGVQYDIQLNEGTDVDALVVQEEVVNVFKWYWGKQNPPFVGGQVPFPALADVTLDDQFGSISYDLLRILGLMNPAIKNGEAEETGTQHLSCYTLDGGTPRLSPPVLDVPFATQNFGEDIARRFSAKQLCVSAMKDDQGSIVGPAFKCYDAVSSQAQPAVFLEDQFVALNGERVVNGLNRFCTPVGVSTPGGVIIPLPPVDEDLDDPTTWRHLACYLIPRDRISPFIDVQLGDIILEEAFGEANKKITFSVEFERRFCEPAIKLLEP